jgi:hypothetical protein
MVLMPRFSSMMLQGTSKQPLPNSADFCISLESFRYLQSWLEDIHNNAGRDMVIILVGNKGTTHSKTVFNNNNNNSFSGHGG